MKKHVAMKKKVSMGNMSGGSPFGKKVKAAFSTNKMIPMKKKSKKK